MNYDILIVIGIMILLGITIVGCSYWSMNKIETSRMREFNMIMNYTRNQFDNDEYANEIVNKIIKNKEFIEVGFGEFNISFGHIKAIITSSILEEEVYKSLNLEDYWEYLLELKQFKIELFEKGKVIYNFRLVESHEMYDELNKVLKEITKNEDNRNREVVRKLLEGK